MQPPSHQLVLQLSIVKATKSKIRGHYFLLDAGRKRGPSGVPFKSTTLQHCHKKPAAEMWHWSLSIRWWSDYISTSDTNLEGLSSKLQRSYEMVKDFYEERNLHINTTKTQLIIFKSPHQKIPENFSVILDGCPVTPSLTVKLLGVILDHHFTMGQHIEEVVKKCHGLLGMLRRAASCLPRDILK